MPRKAQREMIFDCQKDEVGRKLLSMRKVAFFLAGLSLLILHGCATAPPPLAQEDVQKIDYGTYPENYEALIKGHFAKTLHEPESAQYRFGKPYAGFIQHGPLLGGKVLDAGYFAEVWLKAKDRSGGYLPEKHLAVLIKNAEVLLELTAEEFGTIKRAP